MAPTPPYETSSQDRRQARVADADRAERSEVPVYASSVYISDLETMIEQALEQQKRSFKRLKVKIERKPHESEQNADLVALRAIREAVGNELILVITPTEPTTLPTQSG